MISVPISAISALVAVLLLVWPGPRCRRHRHDGTAAVTVAAVSLSATAAHTGPVTGLAGGWLLIEVVALAALVYVAARRTPAGWAVTAIGLGALAGATQPARMWWGADPPATWTEVVFLSLCWTAVVAAAAAAGLARRLGDHRRRRSVAEIRRRERLALAGDLHDLVAHDITGIVLEAQASRAEGAGVTGGALDRIEEAGLQALTAIDRTVDVLRDDGSAAVRTYGVADLPVLLDRFAGGPIAVHTDLEVPPEKVPREVGDVAYRLVAEALTNVRRHAPKARAVYVNGTVDDNVLRITVTDTGQLARRPYGRRAGAGGSGLVGLAARVEALGGALQAGREQGGWSVSASVPLAEPRAKTDGYGW